MKKSKRKYFEQQLSKLNVAQKRQLYKRAANLRKAAQVNARKKRRHTRKEFSAKGDHENMVMFQKHSRADDITIDDWALKVIEEDGLNSIIESVQLQTQQQDYSDSKSGIVVSASAKGCSVQCDGEIVDCLLGPNFAMMQKSEIAIGDKVDFARAKDLTAVIQRVHDRKSKLSRPDPTKQTVERVIASNVDVAVIVASIRRPLLKPALIDRYIIAAQKGGITPYICVNKIDLMQDDDRDNELEVLAPYREIGIKVVECSASHEIGLQELLRELHGKLCVFVGHSGTGKSSLLNAISPDIDAKVGTVHGTTGLGRHTTTNSKLYEIEKDIWIIDTPGIREFGIWAMDSDDLKWYFDEFDDYAESCHYANCSHTHEPNCAVKQALEQGKISNLRYRSYLRILEDLECKPEY